MQNNPIYCTGCSWGFYPENPLNLRIEVQTICGFEYNAAGTSYSLVQFPFSEGRVLSKGGGLYGYEYLMKDHLGNVRVSFEPADNNNITLTQEDYYYPFELRVPIVDQAASKNRYLYNGKEYVNFENLNWYDYGARWYDPQLGRWHVVDPADQFFSPYVYGNNNPINGVDKHGMFWEEFRNYFSGLGWYKDSELKTIQVLSWVKSGATDVGHMALMTEEGNIYGYYPGDEIPFKKVH
ncbi:MAG: hypothetical protein HYV28_12415 [Ignavibacteriales bacterium]|nr:hypothetical protein [Ignavibacteriales bacterium]